MPCAPKPFQATIIMQIPIESFNLQMLNVGFAHHDGDWNWQEVSSPFTRIYCVTRGEARLHMDGRVIDLLPGHLYMIPAYVVHSYECHGLFDHYYLHVYEGFKDQVDLFDHYNFPVEVAAEEIDATLFGIMCEEHPEARLPESDPKSYDNTTTFVDYVKRYNDMSLWQKMRLRSGILKLMSNFLKEATLKPWTLSERMMKVLSYINANIHKAITIDQLADVACITKPYLIRLFRSNFGTPPLQYINKKKIERAQLMLITEDLPSKEIAYKLGFNDASYFIRLFKKTTGQTPQEYRVYRL